MNPSLCILSKITDFFYFKIILLIEDSSTTTTGCARGALLTLSPAANQVYNDIMENVEFFGSALIAASNLQTELFDFVIEF